MVGIMGSARVFDLDCKVDRDGTGILLHSDGLEKRILREVSTTLREVSTTLLTSEASLPTYQTMLKKSGGGQYTFTLHRLIAIVAGNYKLTVFTNETILETLGVRTKNYDRNFEYRQSGEQSYRSLIRELRSGTEKSSECDIDHRAGRDKRHLNCLLHSQATSHKMNTCFSHVRKNARHWCFGLLVMSYRDGNESGSRKECRELADISDNFPSAVQVEAGKSYSNTDLLECLPCNILTEVEKWVTQDVECYCDKLREDAKLKKKTKCDYCLDWNKYGASGKAKRARELHPDKDENVMGNSPVKSRYKTEEN